MIDSFQSLNERFPILETIIKYMNCEERDKVLLKELFLAVYKVGYGDAEIDHRR